MLLFKANHMESLGQILISAYRWAMARIICYPALLMPYEARLSYNHALSALFHFPYRVFGTCARFLLRKLEIEAAPEMPLAHVSSFRPPLPPPAKPEAAVLLYSGGTDSTCVAALLAQEFREVHLLTFHEEATKHSPRPTANIERLRKRFPACEFREHYLDVDPLVRFFSYENYGKNLLRWGILALSTCGFSSLSWHLRAILYARKHGIRTVADGLTRELMHFPGHMDLVVERLGGLYSEFGLEYRNPVRDWPVPPDQQFLDKVIVNHHGMEYVLGQEEDQRTTGAYLYEIGLFSSRNVKGSKIDFQMQHDCYPFTLYNVMAFWGILSFQSEDQFRRKVYQLMGEKIRLASLMLREHLEGKTRSRISQLLGKETE